jgi:hypothetical protein
MSKLIKKKSKMIKPAQLSPLPPPRMDTVRMAPAAASPTPTPTPTPLASYKIPPLILNDILEREHIVNEIKTILVDFDKKREENMFKKGIYIYGPPGSGKTEFVMNILREMNFDIIKYDTGDVRNKSLIDTITKHNMSDRNVLSMMRGEPRKLSIIMDEIDGMNNGDKGGITALIKLIRQKKTKKQKLEDITLNPIICIGNYHTDKKIRELMKVCNVFEIKRPTEHQLVKLLHYYFAAATATATSTVGEKTAAAAAAAAFHKIAHYAQGDLRKMNLYCNYYRKNPAFLENECFFQIKMYNDNTKKITDKLINKHHPISYHNVLMNETDRTIVALLWHENIVDMIAKKPVEVRYGFYMKVLDNICLSDYIDRITFQNQIWQFNEMTSLVKTFHNNKIYHDTFPENKGDFHPAPDVRFTKVLTKYSTEYNNILFIYNLCQQLDLDQKDMLAFFQDIRYRYVDIVEIVDIIFNKYELNKLYIKRVFRYLDKNVKKDADIVEGDMEGECDGDGDDSLDELE